jgi:serine-type D-Ala-D-Ala carboxypeptidase/endopeptidase (penicillin-binding protein 4)
MKPSFLATRWQQPSFFFFLILFLSVWFPSLAPAQWQANEHVENKLKEATLGNKTVLAIQIQDAKNGMPYYSFNADRKITPGSLQRLNTTVVALDLLGPEKQFTTKLEIRGYQQGKAFDGDVVIIGGGDPSLGARFSKNSSDLSAVISSMAEAIKKLKIKTISGSIFGDDSRYANDPISPFWEKMELGEWYSAEVGPLCFNENLVDFYWTSGKKTDDKVKYKMFPETNYVHFTNGVRTGSTHVKTNDIRYFRFPKNNEIRARGRLPQKTKVYDFATIHNPARYTAYLLWEELEKQGITAAGEPMSTSLVPIDDATTQSTVLKQIDSPPLKDLLKVMNTENQNLYAEVLLREIAVAQKKKADFKESCRAVTDWLAKNDLHRTGFLMVDGSGLSSLNSTTARQVTNLFRHVEKSPSRTEFWNSLAQPGQGTLKDRFIAPQDPQPHQLIVKTGNQSGVQGLAGYLESKEGHQYHFTVMLNNFDEHKAIQAQRFLDDLVRDIYTEAMFK